MIVVDASALVAIADAEPDADIFFGSLRNNKAVISAINYVETGLVLIGRQRLRGIADLDQWLRELRVEVATEDLAASALRAYLVYGRGYHVARLNLADCFAYALAKQLDLPLLYKGDDFRLTDVKHAVQPT